MHWLFDYDLTLYGYDEQEVLNALDRNISRFVMERFDLSEAAADALRREYWREYGTTLNGLRALYGVRPEEYFDFIHDGQDLPTPRFAPEKRAVLLGIPGTKWVFTNARRDWAERGLESMGIADCFAGVFDIETMGWHSKPDPFVYLEVERRLNTSPTHLVLLDDHATNLATARTRGWRTVLVHPEADTQSGQYDLRIEALVRLGEGWPRVIRDAAS
jgi:putative hydrolase of the HAD superfamily